MNGQSTASPLSEAPTAKATALKVFGVGNAGIQVTEQLIAAGIPAAACVAVNADGRAPAGSAMAKVQLETRPLRGLGTGGDPERGRAMAEEQVAQLQSLCEGADVVFVVAGLGGGAGTGISPVLARGAKAAGALVLAFVTTPFQCEGSRRNRLAQDGLEELRAVADGVVCLPNDKVLKLIDEETSVLEAFRHLDQLLADGVRGFWRLLTHPGLIEIHFNEVCALLRDGHTESAFAVAEAAGATRSREVLDKLLAHPLLDGGRVLGESPVVLVSLAGGPDLTIAEVNRVMQELNAKCATAQVIMGAAIDEASRERLSLTVIATRKAPEVADGPRCGAAEDLASQLLSQAATGRPGSRFVPPPPALPPERVAQMLARQGAGVRGRKLVPKLRQGQLPLEILSKGRFDKSEPTIHKGEDLDVPTYLRRGVLLN